MSGIVDEIEVLDALTLKSRESFRERVKRGDFDEKSANTVAIHVPDNFSKDTELVFFLDGEDIGSLSAIKVAKLAMKIKIATHGE